MIAIVERYQYREINDYTLLDAYLAVRKDMQRGGIGKACIREIVKMARDNDYKIVTVSALSLTAPSEKYEAVSFYRRCGFRQLELQQKGMTVVPMWRPVN